MKRKNFTFIVVTAVLMLALACTALAVGLNQSAQFTAVKAARTAVMEKYALTDHMLGLFFERVVGEGDGWVISLEPTVQHGEPMGIYTIKVDAKGATEATWSHDGAEISDAQSYDMAAWGPVQLEMLSTYYDEYYRLLAEMESGDEAQVAAARQDLDTLTRAAAEQGLNVGLFPVVAGEDEIPEAEAIALAKEAIVTRYGVSMDELDTYETDVSLSMNFGEKHTEYSIGMSNGNDSTKGACYYSVDMNATNGDITFTRCYQDAPFRRLPEGPLAGYEQAVEEYMESGAFILCTPEEKASIAGRLTEAGLDSYLDGVQYVAPGEGDITLAKAEEAMLDTLAKDYGMQAESLDFFSKDYSLRETDAGRAWHMRLSMDTLEGTDTMFEEQIGEYTVAIDAASGAALKATWSLQDKDTGVAYTETTWGQGAAFPAYTLPWVRAFMTDWDAFYARLEAKRVDENTAPDWSLEDSAELAEMYRAVGFDPAIYRGGLPTEDQLSLEDAIAIIHLALSEEYGIPQDRIETSGYVVSFYMAYGDEPAEYVFIISVFAGGFQDSFDVTINADTGEIIHLDHMTAGNG